MNPPFGAVSVAAKIDFEKGYPRTPTWQAVRTMDWKLIHYADLTGMDELYDLKNDPFEMKNLIKSCMNCWELVFFTENDKIWNEYLFLEALRLISSHKM